SVMRSPAVLKTPKGLPLRTVDIVRSSDCHSSGSRSDAGIGRAKRLGGSSSSESTADTSTSTTTEASKASTSNEVTIELGSNDQMQYDKTELTVKAGQKVTLVLTHTGTMGKTVMGHNFVLLKSGTDVAKFAAKALAANDNEYIPEGDDMIAYTELIGGGENTTITFDAPAAGRYDYICTFPGHYALMKGILTVE
ncbi:MAG: azurin, partial [Bacteroidota bacterium]